MAYKQLYKEYVHLNSFLKDQLYIRLILTYIWSLIIPIMFKLQGFYWTTSFIAVYLIIQQLAKLSVPFFKWMTLKQVYKTLIILDFIYFFSSLTYFYDKHLFLYIEASLAMIFPILIEIFHINYNVYVVNNYSKDVYETISYIGSMMLSLGGILGYVTVIITDLLWSKEDYSMILFCILFILVLIIQVLNFRKNYYNIK